jgi:hypothetical protein
MLVYDKKLACSGASTSCVLTRDFYWYRVSAVTAQVDFEKKNLNEARRIKVNFASQVKVAGQVNKKKD